MRVVKKNPMRRPARAERRFRNTKRAVSPAPKLAIIKSLIKNLLPTRYASFSNSSKIFWLDDSNTRVLSLSIFIFSRLTFSLKGVWWVFALISPRGGIERTVVPEVDGWIFNLNFKPFTVPKVVPKKVVKKRLARRLKRTKKTIYLPRLMRADATYGASLLAEISLLYARFKEVLSRKKM